jgi:hypothetical protein
MFPLHLQIDDVVQPSRPNQYQLKSGVYWTRMGFPPPILTEHVRHIPYLTDVDTQSRERNGGWRHLRFPISLLFMEDDSPDTRN